MVGNCSAVALAVFKKCFKTYKFQSYKHFIVLGTKNFSYQLAIKLVFDCYSY